MNPSLICSLPCPWMLDSQDGPRMNEEWTRSFWIDRSVFTLQTSIIYPGLLFFNKLFYFIYIYFWLCWVFVAARGLSLVEVSGGYSSLLCAGFSLRWLLLLRSTGSRRAGFSSCGTWAQ